MPVILFEPKPVQDNERTQIYTFLPIAYDAADHFDFEKAKLWLFQNQNWSAA